MNKTHREEKQKMKKVLSVILIAIMLSATFVGCSKKIVYVKETQMQQETPVVAAKAPVAAKALRIPRKSLPIQPVATEELDLSSTLTRAIT